MSKAEKKPTTQKTVTAQSAGEVPSFVIENVAMPEKKRASKPSIYPFDALEIGQSFFVAGKTAKDMASTVGSANKRWSENDPSGEHKKNRKGEMVPVRVQTRKFEVVNDTKDGVAGARVGRTA